MQSVLGPVVNNPNKNFAPQVGIAWDPTGSGKTVIRAGAGLFYENVIYNNVLFDRPLRLKSGVSCLSSGLPLWPVAASLRSRWHYLGSFGSVQRVDWAGSSGVGGIPISIPGVRAV